MPNSRDIIMTIQAGGEGAASNAEAWAVGERHGVPVPSTDPTYENNAKYYAGQAASSEGSASRDAGVASQSAQGAAQSEENAQAWATGQRGETGVTSGDPTYHNNAGYYAGQAHDSATAAAGSAGQANSAKQAAETAMSHYPKILNGTWWVWNTTTGDWANTGVKATGDAWHVVNTYASVAAMTADYNNPNINIGDYVMVVNSVEDPDNAKVYIKGSSAWEFVVDMSGATGIQGEPGADAYIHIRYAANQPTQDSDMKTTPDVWMGITSNHSTTAPTAYTSYTWYKIRGNGVASMSINNEYEFTYTFDDGTGGSTNSILPIIRTSTKDAEAWAVGTKDGTPVESSDDTYHNNSKYYAEQAAGQVQQINNSSAKIDNMDAVATGLATGSNPTVAVSEVSGHKRISFGIPAGATGAQGNPGDNAYLHIRYAANQPTQDSDMKTTPDAWIGVCSNHSTTAPTTYTSYTWYKIKGATGDTGATGVGAYVHFRFAAHQPSSDSDMKTIPDEWIGVYSGSSSTAPTTYTSYTWCKIKGEIGQTGATGATGPTGATPQLSIGTVETVAASEGAAASMTGTAENPVLNLQIPRGVAGNESIDDTAGLGDTDLVWSADKSATVVGDLKGVITLQEENIPGTTQTITFDSSGNVSQIVHKNSSNVAIRTDAFTFGTNTITEVRTLYTGETLTIVTNTDTLVTTVTYSAA